MTYLINELIAPLLQTVLYLTLITAYSGTLQIVAFFIVSMTPNNSVN